MRKGIKILGKVFSAAVLLLIILPVFLSLLLDIPAVQNFVVHKAAEVVSRKLETTVSIDRVDIGIFSKIKVQGFYVEDYGRDTLLYVGKLDAYVTGFGIFGGDLAFSRGEIADAKLYLRQMPDGEMNIKQIVNRMSDPDKPKKGNFKLSLKRASIENMDLCLERIDSVAPDYGIDFSHMHLYGLTARVDDFTIDGSAIYTTIAALTARERSGFVLDHLAGRFYMTQGCLGFEDASIVTARSNIRIPYISLVGNSWAEYKDFLGQVRIEAALRNTSVSTDDIAWFAPKLRDWHLDFSNIDVEVAGVVADFTAKVRGMHIGEGTTLVADAVVKGLPDIRDTWFDLSVPRLHSSAEAMDGLAFGIAGRKLSDKLVGILGNSGSIDLNARFRGKLASFDMQLGAATEVRMSPLKKGLSSVRGDVETRNLRLGELLDRRDLLGNATLTAYVDGVIGKGVADANVVGNVTRLGFNGYVYDSLRPHHGPRPQPRFRLLRAGGLQRLGAALRLYDGPAACRPGAPAHQPPRLGVAVVGAHRGQRRRAFVGRPERPHPGDRRPLPVQRQGDRGDERDRHGREFRAEQTRGTAFGFRRCHVPLQNQLSYGVRIPAPERVEIPADAERSPA